MRLFIDTNILIDLLGHRAEHYQPAAELFSLADKGSVELYVSALTMANAAYSLTKGAAQSEVKVWLQKVQLLLHVVALDEKILNWALLDDKFQDFEDALQYCSAKEIKADAIITRNGKDFGASDIPIFNANEFLATLQSGK